MGFIIDDTTARYLLSALLQAMATIWGLVMIFYIFMLQRINENMKDIINLYLQKID